jgi:hypothetical protein
MRFAGVVYAVRALLVLAVALALQGCQTTGPQAEVRLPAVMEPLFTKCLPGDGASSMQLFEDGKLLGSVDAEWVAKANGDWDIEVTNTVGQSVLKLVRRGDGIASSGTLAAKAPKFGVRPSGFLDVDGHLVAVKASEVPCFLGFGFPRSWLKIADGMSVGEHETTVSFDDAVRDIEVDAKGLGDRKEASACAVLTWRKFLFLHHELTWCRALGGARVAELSGLGDYTLKWVKLDDR